MQATSHAFKANAHRALGNPDLQRAMGMMRTGFPAHRAKAIARLPEFEALRENLRDTQSRCCSTSAQMQFGKRLDVGSAASDDTGQHTD